MDNAFWVGIAGMFFTLLGTVIGAHLSQRAQEKSWAREDRTRFHAFRVEVYVKVLAAANQLLAQVSIVGTLPFDEARDFIQGFESLRLVATEPVLVPAVAIHSLVTRVSKATTDGKGLDVSAIQAEFSDLVGKLVNEIRKEIGIAGQPQS